MMKKSSGAPRVYTRPPVFRSLVPCDLEHRLLEVYRDVLPGRFVAEKRLRAESKGPIDGGLWVDHRSLSSTPTDLGRQSARVMEVRFGLAIQPYGEVVRTRGNGMDRAVPELTPSIGSEGLAVPKMNPGPETVTPKAGLVFTGSRRSKSLCALLLDLRPNTHRQHSFLLTSKGRYLGDLALPVEVLSRAKEALTAARHQGIGLPHTLPSFTTGPEPQVVGDLSQERDDSSEHSVTMYRLSPEIVSLRSLFNPGRSGVSSEGLSCPRAVLPPTVSPTSSLLCSVKLSSLWSGYQSFEVI